MRQWTLAQQKVLPVYTLAKVIFPLSDTYIAKTEYLDTYAYDGSNVIRLLGGVLPPPFHLLFLLLIYSLKSEIFLKKQQHWNDTLGR